MMSNQLCRDVLQVCRNGHVITDLLLAHPELGRSHCERCGATTFSRCPVCGRDLPGAMPVPGLVPIGERRAPEHCPHCGAAFPWADQPAPPRLSVTVELLEKLLRRLPRAARQLRDRHGCRSSLLVEDDFDLQDLLRFVLYLHFEDVRHETRTPSYATRTRTDYEVCGAARIAITAKLTTSGVSEQQLAAELEEDVAYYERAGERACLLCLVYDPGQMLPRPEQIEAAWRQTCGEMEVRCVVAR
jgi:hypothetical protein